MWKRLHWTTRRDLKTAFWVLLLLAPVLLFVLWDEQGSEGASPLQHTVNGKPGRGGGDR